MDGYKSQFIEFLLKTGALRVGKDHMLKSKRMSPWFVNVGDFNDGESTAALGAAYADVLLSSGAEFDFLYGIPEKGTALAVATAIGLQFQERNVPWFFTRKVPKEYGEATSLSPAERIKALVVGRAPQKGQRIAQLDDVFTAGDAKYEARAVLDSLGEFQFPLLAIAVDRQEVGIDGKSAIAEYEARTKTRVVSIISACEVYEFLRKNVPLTTPSGDITSEHVTRMEMYLRVYGTEAVRKSLPAFNQSIILQDRSVIVASDVATLEEFEELVKQTTNVNGIGGYKIGFTLGLGYGLDRVVEAARRHTSKSLIYDHQKAGTDIPDTGKDFAAVCVRAGIDAVILFPQAGPETERAWMYHALDKGLGVIVGGRMTHAAYAQSEGGFITDEGALEMYRIAARAGISHFVVPGNKPDVITTVRETVEAEGVAPVFYAPGFVAQGGKIEEATRVAGDKWHAIVGRGIYQAPDKHAAAVEHTSKLNAQ